MTDLPRGWTNARISEICTINPRVDKTKLDPASVVSFVPMPAVEAETGNVDVSETRTFERVRKGYTPFREDDILFAKITPCMENGKMAVVPEMASTYGFGSTEFHVLRPFGGIDSRFIYHAVSNRAFRFHAEHKMTGAVGQKRVPDIVLKQHEIRLPPTNEQHRIVEKIEALFAEIDKGVESLKVAQSTIDLYRKSLLKSAFEGRLTAEWRVRNPDKLEDPEALLARIREERQANYQAALSDWERAVANWKESGEQGKKPAKPRFPPIVQVCEQEGLGTLPVGWIYVPFEALAWPIRNGIAVKPDGFGPLKIFRISAVRPMAFDLSDFRQITDPDGEMAAFRLNYGDIVFTRYNGSRDYVGVSAMYRGDGSHVHPDKLIRCEIDNNVVNPAYLERATNCGESRKHLEARIRTTAGQSGVSGGDIRSTPVPICSSAEQAEIVRTLDSRLEVVEALRNEIDANLIRVQALRQSILKQAFSGQLVPQDPNDEPASVLLGHIKAESAPERRKPASRQREAAQ